MTNRMMDRMNVPGYAWYLFMAFACAILNNSVDPAVANGTMTPLMMSTFHTTDISPFDSLSLLSGNQSTSSLMNSTNRSPESLKKFVVVLLVSVNILVMI